MVIDHAPGGGEDGAGQVKDMIEDPNLASPEDELETYFNKERAMGLLDLLTERERKILDMRFGLTDGNTHTLAEIALTIGVSRERIRQVEYATIRKIRKLMKKKEKKQTKSDDN